MKDKTYSSGGVIECPVCGGEFADLWEYVTDDGDDEDIECPCCEAPLNLECSVVVNYAARPREVKP